MPLNIGWLDGIIGMYMNIKSCNKNDKKQCTHLQRDCTHESLVVPDAIFYLTHPFRTSSFFWLQFGGVSDLWPCALKADHGAKTVVMTHSSTLPARLWRTSTGLESYYENTKLTSKCYESSAFTISRIKVILYHVCGWAGCSDSSVHTVCHKLMQSTLP